MNSTVTGLMAAAGVLTGPEKELFGECGIGGVNTGISKECLRRLVSRNRACVPEKSGCVALDK